MSPPELSATPVEFVIRARVEGKRIDAYLTARFPDYSRSVIQKVIDAGAVLVNGQPVRASSKVKLGDAVRVWLPELDDGPPLPEDICGAGPQCLIAAPTSPEYAYVAVVTSDLDAGPHNVRIEYLDQVTAVCP